jgi:hypothetical protein
MKIPNIFIGARIATTILLGKLLERRSFVMINAVSVIIIEDVLNQANTLHISARSARRAPKKVTMGKRKIGGKRK